MGLALVDSCATTREICAAFHTAVRAWGDETQARRRSLFFRVVIAVPGRHLKQQPWPWRSLRGAWKVRAEMCQWMRLRGGKIWSALDVEAEK